MICAYIWLLERIQPDVVSELFQRYDDAFFYAFSTNTRSGCFINHFRTLLIYFLPVLPTLRLITSSAYLIPLPLYGSGLLLSLISAAYWPTFSLLIPETMILFPSTLVPILLDLPFLLGENILRKEQVSYPVSELYNLHRLLQALLYPSLTPTTMLWIRVLVRPCNAFIFFKSFGLVTTT